MIIEPGVPHPDNTPSARYGACLTEDLNGDLWLFGGQNDGLNKYKTLLIHKGRLVDLWKYNGSMWTFVKGPLGIDTERVPSPLRTPDPNAHPGGRYGHTCWSDNNGHIWVHGGTHFIPGKSFIFDISPVARNVVSRHLEI